MFYQQKKQFFNVLSDVIGKRWQWDNAALLPTPLWLQVTLHKFDKRLYEISPRHVLHSENGKMINFPFMSTLTLNSDPIVCLCAYLLLFHTHSFTYSPCWLLYSVPLCSLHHKFLVLFSNYFFFWDTVQYWFFSYSLKQLNYFDYEIFSMPKTEADKDTRRRKFNPASSNSKKVWHCKKHALVLYQEIFTKVSNIYLTFKSFLSSGAADVPKNAREQKGHVQVVKMYICWTKDQITTHSFHCLTDARISLKNISGLWRWIILFILSSKGANDSQSLPQVLINK